MKIVNPGILPIYLCHCGTPWLGVTFWWFVLVWKKKTMEFSLKLVGKVCQGVRKLGCK